jgi:hypothetical protein
MVSKTSGQVRAILDERELEPLNGPWLCGVYLFATENREQIPPERIQE